MSGGGWRGGGIDSASTGVRVRFIGEDLAEIANRIKPMLTSTVKTAFPRSPTKRLATAWDWWLFKDGAITKARTGGINLGERVPTSVSIYDVLFLAPRAVSTRRGGAPAYYAWIANRNVKQSVVPKRFNLKRRGGKQLVKKQLKGFIAETTRRMRSSLGSTGRAGVIVQGYFVRTGMTASASQFRHGIPVIRVAFRKSLQQSISVR